jgi:hypothetical protein
MGPSYIDDVCGGRCKNEYWGHTNLIGGSISGAYGGSDECILQAFTVVSTDGTLGA